MKKSMCNKRFQEYCFSPTEREQYEGKPLQMAGCFAAKEALSKALGTGVRGFGMNEITVLRNDLGKPYFDFADRIQQIIQQKNITAHLTISHSGNLVIANVILEVNNETDHVI